MLPHSRNVFISSYDLPGMCTLPVTFCAYLLSELCILTASMKTAPHFYLKLGKMHIVHVRMLYSVVKHIVRFL
jgi:hypothetical protein